MSGDLTTAGITFGAALIAAAGTVAVGRRSRDADERGNEIQSDAGVAAGYNLLTSDLRRDIEELRRDRDKDRERIDDLEDRLDKVVKRYRAAVKYIRQLLAFVANELPGHNAPPPPDDLLLDLD